MYISNILKLKLAINFYTFSKVEIDFKVSKVILQNSDNVKFP